MKVIHSSSISFQKLLHEMITKKDVLILLAKRDIYLRYRYKTIGILWGILQPIALALVISVSLGKTVLTSLSFPYYFLSVLIGYTFWIYFSTSIGKMTTSLLSHRTLVKNAAFPHLMLPLSLLSVGFIDFSFSLFLSLFLAFYFGFFSPYLFLLLVSMLLMLLTTIGLGTLFSMLYTQYTDIREPLSFGITLLFYLTPVIYPVHIIPQEFALYLYLNPMAGVIETAKAALIDPKLFNIQGILISMGSGLCILFLGLFLFFKKDPMISDIV